MKLLKLITPIAFLARTTLAKPWSDPWNTQLPGQCGKFLVPFFGEEETIYFWHGPVQTPGKMTHVGVLTYPGCEMLFYTGADQTGKSFFVKENSRIGFTETFGVEVKSYRAMKAGTYVPGKDISSSDGNPSKGNSSSGNSSNGNSSPAKFTSGSRSVTNGGKYLVKYYDGNTMKDVVAVFQPLGKCPASSFDLVINKEGRVFAQGSVKVETNKAKIWNAFKWWSRAGHNCGQTINVKNYSPLDVQIWVQNGPVLKVGRA